MLFSFLVGVFIILILRPICKGDDCINYVTPEVKEIESSTYQLGSKCYQFKSSVLDLA